MWQKARSLALGTTKWAAVAVLAMAAVMAGTVALGLLIVGIFIFSLDDDAFDNPVAPPFSASVAEELVAEHLCPQTPELVKPELIASEDSGTYHVYVRASSDVTAISSVGNALAVFGFCWDANGQPRVVPASDGSKLFLAAVRAACADGRRPWPQLADR